MGERGWVVGRLSGTGARLAGVCVLLSVTVVACASPAPGASPAGAGAQGSVSGPHTLGNPTPTAPASPERMTHPATAEPTAPVPVVKGCPSGTVAITHYPGDWYESTVCIKAGARLRLTLTTGGIGSWDPLRVAPEGAATVTCTTDSTAVHAIVSPAGKASFC